MLNLHRGAHLTLFLTRNVRCGADYLLHLLYNNLTLFLTRNELKFPNGCKLDSKGRVIIER